MVPLGHCNMAEMYFKNIILKYVKQDSEMIERLNIPQHTLLHLYLGGRGGEVQVFDLLK